MTFLSHRARGAVLVVRRYRVVVLEGMRAGEASVSERSGYVSGSSDVSSRA